MLERDEVISVLKDIEMSLLSETFKLSETEYWIHMGFCPYLINEGIEGRLQKKVIEFLINSFGIMYPYRHREILIGGGFWFPSNGIKERLNIVRHAIKNN